MGNRDARNAGSIAVWIRIAGALAVAVMIAVALALIVEPPARAGWCDGNPPNDYEWLRTHAARQQDERCDNGDVCRELCLVRQCDGGVEPTGHFNCFDS